MTKNEKKLKENFNIENNFDSFFKDKLSNAQIQAPADAWTNIANQLSAPLTPEPVSQIIAAKAVIVKVVVVSTAIIATTVGIVFYNQTQEKADAENIEVVSMNEEMFLADNASQEVVVIHNQPTMKEEDFSTSEELKSKIQQKPIVPNVGTNKENNNTNITSNLNSSIQKNNNVVAEKTIEIRTDFNPIKEDLIKEIWLLDTFVCDKKFNPNANYFGSPYVKFQKVDLQHQKSFDEMAVVMGSFIETNTIKRRVYFNNSSCELKVKNKGENAIFAELTINGKREIKEIVWNFNHESFASNVKEITYYRNLELGLNQESLLEVKILDNKNCLDSIMKDVRLLFEERFDPIIPNVFTPNNDGLNDNFEIKISGESHYHLRVFDKENTLLFESTNKNIMWNGTNTYGIEMPAAKYIYTFEYKFESESIQRSHGVIQLIRN